MREEAQVVIIGGGIIGCSIAYHLTQLGWHDVILIEADGRLQGFSTLRNMEARIDGRAHYAVFSGDTVVDKTGWGSRVLGRTAKCDASSNSSRTREAPIPTKSSMNSEPEME